MGRFENVSVMMGAVDETDSLRQTVMTVLDICEHKDLKEIIIGYSQHVTKESRAVVDELAAMDSDIPIVTFEQKRKGISGLVDMIDIARGSHCILVASDMALDLECINKMIRGAKETGGDVIISSSRWLDGCSFYGYSKIKHLVNYMAQKFLAVLFGADITDFTIPYQIAPTELYQSIEFENEGFPILIEMVLKPLRLGYDFREVPTNCYSRKQGKSKNSVKQTVMYLGTALHIRIMKKSSILKKDCVLAGRLIKK